MYFFYSKRPPSPAKADVLHEKKCRFLLKKTIQPRKNLKFCIKKWHKRYQKDHPSPQKLKFCMKKKYFFTQKDHPPPHKPEVLHEQMRKNWQKRYQKEHPAPLKTWIVAWKIKNRPTYWDFEKKKIEKKSRTPTSPNV